MTNYKENKMSIGSSDLAQLVLRSPEGIATLDFGEDGSYGAYIVYDDALIPSHYHRVFSAKSWLWVYDDDGIAAKFKGKYIRVFRAGERGCLIHVAKIE